ncbi:MAG: hypothetical protein IT475_00950 [Aquimonas sp.]|nr:hypothetical protein [Aquimonas sp.]
MKRTEQITATLLSLTTVAISMLLVTYGVAIVFGEKTPLWTQIFAMTAIASGALIIAAGAWAWFGGGERSDKNGKNGLGGILRSVCWRIHGRRNDQRT